MDKQIKGEKMISLLGIAPSDLAEYIENGLPARTQSGKEVYIVSEPPSQKASDNARYRFTVHEMSIERGQGGISSDISPYPPGLHGIDLPLPQNEEEADEIIKEILGFYFLIDDYEKFAKNHALESLINRQDISEPKLLFPEPDEISEPEPERFTKGIDELGNRNPVERIDTDQFQKNSFILNNDFWDVTFGGENAHIIARERILYIVHLIDNPGVEIYSHDLVALVKGDNQVYSKLDSERLDKEGLSFSELQLNDLSDSDKCVLEEQAYKSWEKLRQSSKNTSEYREMEKQWESLKRHFSNEYGVVIMQSAKGLKFKFLGRLNNDAEKQRQLAQKQITKAKKDFKKPMPSLYSHLKLIDTGAKCIYRNDKENPIKWHIKK